jgi:hypothetical protein
VQNTALVVLVVLLLLGAAVTAGALDIGAEVDVEEVVLGLRLCLREVSR